MFETAVARCIEEGLVGGQHFAVDASLIAADANRQNSTPKEEWLPDEINPDDAPRAVKEYLDTLDDAAFGAATTVTPKFTSHSDSASQWTFSNCRKRHTRMPAIAFRFVCLFSQSKAKIGGISHLYKQIDVVF